MLECLRVICKWLSLQLGGPAYMGNCGTCCICHATPSLAVLLQDPGHPVSHTATSTAFLYYSEFGLQWTETAEINFHAFVWFMSWSIFLRIRKGIQLANHCAPPHVSLFPVPLLFPG